MDDDTVQDCSTCDWFDPTGVNHMGQEIGCCRVNPPVVTDMHSPWPRVCESDWCGRWALSRELSHTKKA